MDENKTKPQLIKELHELRKYTAVLERKESLHLAQFVFDHANIGIYCIAPDGRILETNQKAAQLLGYPQKELTSLSMSDIDPRVARESWEISWHQLLDVQGMKTFEREYMRKDGSMIPVEINSNFFEYEGQKYAIAFVQDITERKQMEQVLKKNEERLKDLIGNVPGVVYQFTAEPDNLEAGKFISMVREKIIEIFGLDAELGNFFNRFSACLPEKDRMRFRTSVKDVSETLNPWNYEGKFIKPSGESIWFEGRSLQRKIGDKVAFYGFLADITLRKKTEEELHRLRNYLSNIIDSMPSILVAVDREVRVTQWNNQTALATGLSFESAISRPLAEVFPRLADEMERIQESIRERRVITSPKVSHKVAQETRYEDVTIFPLVANGMDGAVIRIDNVTEKVRLEEMMIQNEKMLSVGGLAAGMAHEINNPLAGMMQTAGVMASRLGANLDIPANRKAAQEAGTTVAAVARFMEIRGIPRMLETIKDSGKRVAEIVENMLSFARKSESTVSTQNLGDLLDKTLELAVTDYDLKKKYDFKCIAIEKDYAYPPVFVPCEDTKIQQVLLNILRNGAEAMSDTASPKFIFRTRQEEDAAVIEIEDNGPGMDETTRKKVFDPFFTTKPVGEGTGLGLSVSYFIVTENHRGEMTVESRPGLGARFIIRLPVKGGNLAANNHDRG